MRLKKSNRPIEQLVFIHAFEQRPQILSITELTSVSYSLLASLLNASVAMITFILLKPLNVIIHGPDPNPQPRPERTDRKQIFDTSSPLCLSFLSF